MYQSDIQAHIALQDDAVAQGIKLLQNFLHDCQAHYFAFHSAMDGVDQRRAKFERIIDPTNNYNLISVGSAFPNAPQSQGSSTIAQMAQGQFLENSQEGGLFENQHGKALIVVIFHLWDEYYRPQITKCISVCHKQVECDLMGDIRLVRNRIIHGKSTLPEQFQERLKLLPSIWALDAGELSVTRKMIDSFMEKLNAIQVRIAAPKEGK